MFATYGHSAGRPDTDHNIDSHFSCESKTLYKINGQKHYKIKKISDRKTREEIKWNQITALRFQTGGDIRYAQPPLGDDDNVNDKLDHDDRDDDNDNDKTFEAVVSNY